MAFQIQPKATPHNGARAIDERFCPRRKFGKCGNTGCISHFSNCAGGAKDPSKAAAPIVRCCPNKKESENKTIRFPVPLIERINQALTGTDVSFSSFVIQACEFALDNLADPEQESARETKP